ncbi:glutamate--putrescine ligase [Rhodovulum imhoffii]|uniref:Glutamate--putrescine ligase n=1 Tax=Rhodovulum imhoffii TaxID=365340 RepID=A0A2T5BQT7_9RHOB|nr:glutamine synthetase family protein [Rhodovulum imhoffii]MBK5933864.1 glutamine synthetase [Rhodovulum imhoffii]PTN01548.1 glutamate--putrescine ligase [Rhodovulum imhoffii]
MTDWLRDHPEIRTVRVAACDLNGQARGKSMPARFAGKVEDEGTRFPLSALNLDIWGEDIEESPLVFETGDADGLLRPTGRGFVPIPWLDAPAALLPLWMFNEDGSPFSGDPRHALARVLDAYEARGWYPQVATELEFYLIDDSGDHLHPPRSPRSGKRRVAAEVLALRTLDAFDDFFTDIYDACEAMDIPADAAISEAGLGQFEINLLHGPAMKAADDTWLFKLLVKGLARCHGVAGSFMAKPYPEHAGNGLHMHFSVLDSDGNNIFDDARPDGPAQLRAAVAGCLAALPDSALILAPHANSYDRLVPGAHAPTGICWAHENRTAAIRIPGGSPRARRIEHRVAGGDINPYLTIAAVLGAALQGIEDGLTPPAPITGNAYGQKLPQLPADWAGAIDRFEASDRMARIFPREMIRNYVMTKRQELRRMAGLDEDERTGLYLDTV